MRLLRKSWAGLAPNTPQQPRLPMTLTMFQIYFFFKKLVFLQTKMTDKGINQNKFLRRGWNNDHVLPTQILRGYSDLHLTLMLL